MLRHGTLLFFLFFSTLLKAQGRIDGVYMGGSEALHIDSKNKTFFLRRSKPKLEDVLVPVCYDTIAKGHFKVISRDVVMLFNGKNFHSVEYHLKQERRLSADTLYFNVVLPQDDDFKPGRFRFLLNVSCIIGQIKSDSAFIKIPVGKVGSCGFLKLSIQDLMPESGIEEEKFYQRIYFSIFDLVPIADGSNYFIITLPNFNECYVERMDVNNDLIYFNEAGTIYWRGKEFRKVK